MQNWLLATIPLVLAILKATVKNPKAKAALKEVGFMLYVTVLSIWPEFAAPVTSAAKKRALAALPKIA